MEDNDRNSRVILTKDERELLNLINDIKREIMVNKELTGKMNIDRIMNVMNLKDILLKSLLDRS